MSAKSKKLSDSFRSPFLKRISVPATGRREFPFQLPLFEHGFEIELETPITLIVGENGSGKSTLLEAIGASCGFHPNGGSRNHYYDEQNVDRTPPLAKEMKLSWLPRVTSGFFMRAESFFHFASYIDNLAKTDPSLSESYGGKLLHEQSHGESFLALFKNRFSGRGIFILDEPEAALSPMRQLAFLVLLKDLEASGTAQFVIATHSPILLNCPGATVLSIDGGIIEKVDPKDTDHYRITKTFLDNPEQYLHRLFDDDPSATRNQ